jgi:polysaccharide export outer membrane protein
MLGYALSLRSTLAIFVLAGSLVHCTAVPKDGPTASLIRDDADVTVHRTAPTLAYAMVEISPLAVEATNAATVAAYPSFPRMPLRSASTDVRIGTGDILNLTIFESQAGGLFIPQEAGSRAGNFVSVPNQQVDASGNITVPYAGTLRVVGLTAEAASAEITRRLASRAIEPQVVVTIAERRGNEVSVLGEVNGPLRFSLDPGGVRLLGAIARAGGPRNPPYETIITLQRKGRTSQAAMTNVIRDPKQNIQIAPGDVIYLSREPKVFMALGATPSPGSIGGTNNRRFTFDSDNISLSEAVAKAGGLDSLRADPGAVFVFRMEPKSTLVKLGVDVRPYKEDRIPTIYTADWTQADGFFLANSFYMRDKDIVFVSDHPTTDIAKFAAFVHGLLTPATDVATISNSLR